MSNLAADSPVSKPIAVAATSRAALRLPLLAVVGAELLLLYAPTIRWLIDRWSMSVWHNAHGFLIPPDRRLLRVAGAEAAAPQARLVERVGLRVPGAGARDAHARHGHPQRDSLCLFDRRDPARPGPAVPGRRAHEGDRVPARFHAADAADSARHHRADSPRAPEIATDAAAVIVPLFGIPVYSEGTSLHIGNGELFIGMGLQRLLDLYAAVAVAALTAYSCNHWRGRAPALVAPCHL